MNHGADCVPVAPAARSRHAQLLRRDTRQSATGEPTPLETGGSGGPGVWIAALAGKRSEGTDHDQHARAIFLQAHIEVDGVGPQVNVALAVQVALRPGLELLLPDLLESHDVIRR